MRGKNSEIDRRAGQHPLRPIRKLSREGQSLPFARARRGPALSQFFPLPSDSLFPSYEPSEILEPGTSVARGTGVSGRLFFTEPDLRHHRPLSLAAVPAKVQSLPGDREGSGTYESALE